MTEALLLKITTLTVLGVAGVLAGVSAWEIWNRK